MFFDSSNNQTQRLKHITHVFQGMLNCTPLGTCLKMNLCSIQMKMVVVPLEFFNQWVWEGNSVLGKLPWFFSYPQIGDFLHLRPAWALHLPGDWFNNWFIKIFKNILYKSLVQVSRIWKTILLKWNCMHFSYYKL